jgi:glycosyltransferase involved in cell wall biosynthesis
LNGSFARRRSCRNRFKQREASGTISPTRALPELNELEACKMMPTAPQSRNAPCPCGSGKRYKLCHGLLPPSTSAAQLAAQGLAAHERGDIAIATATYQQALVIEPNNPDVLHMLGVTHMQRFEITSALARIERAADLTDWQIPAMRQNYGWALSALMTARAPAQLLGRRAAAEGPLWDQSAQLNLSPQRQGLMREFVDRVIASRDVPNPQEPHIPGDDRDGVEVLKPALRGGLGSVLDRAQLLRIAELTLASQATAPLCPQGIEFIGFAKAESGLGENLRALVGAVATTPLAASVSVTDVDLDFGARSNDTRMSSHIDGRSFRTRVVCVNPDVLGQAFHHVGIARHQDAYRIGFWELDRIPRSWLDSVRLFDELWAATEYVADALRRDVQDRPVLKIRTPVSAPLLDRSYARSEFGLRDDTCVFMFSFAYGSFATRKNPWAVIRAFRQAFPNGTEQVQLVIKSSQSELFEAARDALTALALDDPRIVFINGYLSRSEIEGLQSLIDCYMSLHRSEGLGLGLAECMAQGKPTIATAYSGNLEFMKPDNSLLVDYSLIPVREGGYPDFAGQVWADASVEHAAAHMQTVYTDRERARRMGAAAASHMAEHFSHHAVGQTIFARYSAIAAAS